MTILFWVVFVYMIMVSLVYFIQTFRAKEVSVRVMAFICTLLQVLACYFLWNSL